MGTFTFFRQAQQKTNGLEQRTESIHIQPSYR